MLPPTSTEEPAANVPGPEAKVLLDALSRRGFLAVSVGLVGVAVAACGGGSDTTAPPTGGAGGTGGTGGTGGGGTGGSGLPAGVTISGSQINIDRSVATSLDADGYLYLASATVIVVRLGAGNYRAFSSSCTHEGCPVARVESGRMKCGTTACPGHGSEFRTDGSVAVGPAVTSLRAYATTSSGNITTVTIA